MAIEKLLLKCLMEQPFGNYIIDQIIKAHKFMDIETRLEEELQALAKNVDQYERCSFFSDDWQGTKEQLNEFKYYLQELKTRGYIEFKSELAGNGEFYQIKITPKGYMRLKDQL